MHHIRATILYIKEIPYLGFFLLENCHIQKQLFACYITCMPNTDSIQYLPTNTHDGFDAMLHGHRIGQITFVRVGIDKLIIEYTGVDPNFRHKNIGLSLVRSVAHMARNQKRHVITLCPFARAMFNRYSEFDDIRLMNAH